MSDLVSCFQDAVTDIKIFSQATVSDNAFKPPYNFVLFPVFSNIFTDSVKLYIWLIDLNFEHKLITEDTFFNDRAYLYRLL